ncbi:MAG: hypothetical protein AB7O44_30380 [Hyphomicrobiaceae bacterium]
MAWSYNKTDTAAVLKRDIGNFDPLHQPIKDGEREIALSFKRTAARFMTEVSDKSKIYAVSASGDQDESNGGLVVTASYSITPQ